MKKTIEFKRLTSKDGIQFYAPKYQTQGAAAMDIHAYLHEEITIYPGCSVLIPTGFAIRINDPGLVGILAGRSGLALKSSVKLGNGIGVIDSDYNQELGVILENNDIDFFTVRNGDRIAQLMFMPVDQVNIMFVDEFSTTTNRGGFGSTGI